VYIATVDASKASYPSNRLMLDRPVWAYKHDFPLTWTSRQLFVAIPNNPHNV